MIEYTAQNTNKHKVILL